MTGEKNQCRAPRIVPGRNPTLTVGLLVFWTIVTVLILWKVAFDDAPAHFSTHEGTGFGTDWMERVREWFFLAQLNFGWALPSALFSPYVLWLGWRFHLRRKKLWPFFAVLTMGGLIFAGGATWLSQRIAARQFGTITLVISKQTQPATAESEIRFFPVPDNGISSNSIELTTTFQGLPWATNLSLAKIHRLNQSLMLALSNSTSQIVSNDASDSAEFNRLDLNQLFKDMSLNSTMSDQVRQILVHGRRSSKKEFAFHSFAYVGLMGLVHALAFYHHSRKQEIQAEILSNRLNEAQLKTLQDQLRPHFLFNTLNSISVLVRRNPAEAEEMLIALSELLRAGLNGTQNHEIPFREELALLDRYVGILLMRFGDRLRFERDIEESTLDCLSPRLLLQPLVENAICHGIEPSGNAGTVRIVARKANNRLQIEVEDDGVGFQSGRSPADQGIGLSNLAKRLATLYPDEHEFSIGNRPAGGTRVRIAFPVRVQP